MAKKLKPKITFMEILQRSDGPQGETWWGMAHNEKWGTNNATDSMVTAYGSTPVEMVNRVLRAFELPTSLTD